MLLYNYVDTPNNNLVCCICRAPFTDPVTTTTCQHTFCRDCITRALTHSPQCPVDRSPLALNDLGPVNPIVRSLVDELTVECVYREEGCRHRVQRQLLAAHLKDECEFSEAGSVRNELCKLKEKEMNESCAAHPESSETIPPFEMSEEPVPKGPLGNEDETSTTASGSGAIPSSSRGVSRLTEQNILLRHRVDTLEGAVQILRKEMLMVRTVLSPWIQNCAASGQPSTSGAGNRIPASEVDVRASSNFTSPAAERDYRPRTNNTTPGINSPDDSVPRGSQVGSSNDEGRSRSEDRPVDRNDLASYFPADDEVRVRRTATSSIPEYSQTQRQPRPPGVGHLHHHSVPSVPGMNPADIHPTMSPMGIGGGYFGHPLTSPYGAMGMYGAILSPPTGPQHQPQAGDFTIPDLDTSTPSISTTLEGLHSTVEVLAAAMGELNKKGDVALALMGGGTGGALPGGGVVGEVLRLGEEVMGVRATVQGLRMQMHALMMGNVGVGVGAAGNGMGMGFSGGRPPQSANGSEGGNTEGYGLPSPMTQGLQNQRMFYPVAPGITKL